MRKLNTNNAGRMPLWQKDLEFIQDGLTKPLEALVGELGCPSDYFIITGCEPYMPDNSHIAMDAGWFYYGGRILPARQLPPTSVAGFANPMVRLDKVTYSNPAGARNFIAPDQTSVPVEDVWRDDYLRPSVVEREASFDSGVRIGVGAWTLRDMLAHQADAESEWTPGRSGDLEYKRVGRMVVLRGIATNVTTTYNPVDEGFPLPLGGMAILHQAANQEDFLIYINDRGELVCHSYGGQGEPTLTGMTYLAETPYRATDPNTINDNGDTHDADGNTPQQ